MARPTEFVDVLIVGSGPAGSAYARAIGDALPDASILMVEVGPKLSELAGDHTNNMNADDRLACQLLSQGPDAGVKRAGFSAGNIALDRKDDTPFIFPGLFPL